MRNDEEEVLDCISQVEFKEEFGFYPELRSREEIIDRIKYVKSRMEKEDDNRTDPQLLYYTTVYLALKWVLGGE
jgi:hypothetical protein